MGDDSPTQTLPRLDTTCPSCGAPAEEGQLVCLECGARLALDYRRPSGWKPAAAIVALVLLVAGAAFTIALLAVDDSAEDEEKDTRAGRQRPAASERPAAERRTRERPAERRTRERSERPPSRGGTRSWPRGRNGFTVVLLSAEDRASARIVAAEARRGGIDVGLLRSDDYSSLGTGFWIVFSGVYRTQARAERAAGRLARSYSGAFPQFVKGAQRR